MALILGNNKSIKIQTRIGSDVVNNQILNLEENALFNHQLAELKRKHLGIIERPYTISGIYNCHGFTFANKKTGIDHSSELQKILQEDHYKEISDYANILAGDVVIYLDEDGDYSHSGIVINAPDDIKQIYTTKIISKWGDGYEVIHALNNCPYPLGNIKFYRCLGNEQLYRNIRL